MDTSNNTLETKGVFYLEHGGSSSFSRFKLRKPVWVPIEFPSLPFETLF